MDAYFDDYADSIPGDDIALAQTIKFPGQKLVHEPNNTCWCEPIVYAVVDQDGDIMYYALKHRRVDL